MNYLGHIYFSNQNWELMQYNLMGDFIKGKDLQHLDEKIQIGSTVHREIDSFIDNHPIVKELQRSLYDELPKVSSVAIDLYFDHLLAKNWSQFHTQSLLLFLETFYAKIDLNNPHFIPDFQLMLSKMIEINWISHYPSLDGLDKMCNGVSRRISFENKLKEGKTVFLKHESFIEQVFWKFMDDAVSHFEQFYTQFPNLSPFLR